MKLATQGRNGGQTEKNEKKTGTKFIWGLSRMGLLL